MKLKLSKKVLLDWKSFLALEKFDTKSHREMEKGDSIHLANIQIRLFIGNCSLMLQRKKKSSLSDSKEAFCLNTNM